MSKNSAVNEKIQSNSDRTNKDKTKYITKIVVNYLKILKLLSNLFRNLIYWSNFIRLSQKLFNAELKKLLVMFSFFMHKNIEFGI